MILRILRRVSVIISSDLLDLLDLDTRILRYSFRSQYQYGKISELYQE